MSTRPETSCSCSASTSGTRKSSRQPTNGAGASRASARWASGPRELGLAIVLELEPFKLSLVNDIDTMVRFLDDVDLPSVQANIDVSHLVLSGVRPEELRRLAGRAGHVHISDCDGKVHGDLPPGRGVVNFEPYLREIKALDIDGAISIELEYSPQPERIVPWVEEAYRETARLLAAAGLRKSVMSVAHEGMIQRAPTLPQPLPGREGSFLTVQSPFPDLQSAFSNPQFPLTPFASSRARVAPCLRGRRRPACCAPRPAALRRGKAGTRVRSSRR